LGSGDETGGKSWRRLSGLAVVGRALAAIVGRLEFIRSSVWFVCLVWFASEWCSIVAALLHHASLPICQAALGTLMPPILRIDCAMSPTSGGQPVGAKPFGQIQVVAP